MEPVDVLRDGWELTCGKRTERAIMIKQLSTCAVILAFFAATESVADRFFEGFDEPGSSWSSTIFPDTVLIGSGSFVRTPIDPGMGAPNTFPFLPINEGGDKEGHFSGFSTIPHSNFAFMDDTPENSFEHATIDGFVSFGNVAAGGSRNAGFVLRGSTEPVNAYVAWLTVGTFTAFIDIYRVRDNELGAERLTQSPRFWINTESSNLHVVFTARRNTLTVSLWRVQVKGGVIVETPIDLKSEVGIQNTISVVDHELTRGRAGLTARLGGANNFFFEDVVVISDDLPGDLNCDGAINGADIDAFFVAIGDAHRYIALYPGCNVSNADMNADGIVNGADIDPFFLCLGGGFCP